MHRKVYTYADLAKLPESKQFAQIKKYPIITVASDLRKALVGRYEFDRVNGLFRTDERVHVTDFRSFSQLIDKNWGNDQCKFNQLVILAEFLRNKLEAAGDDQKDRNWLIGCMRNLRRMHSAIRLLEEAGIEPDAIESGSDRNQTLMVDAWKNLIERDPEIKAHRAKIQKLTEKSAWESILSEAFHITDVSNIDKIVIHGFYYITPLQESVLKKLEEAGYELIFLIPYDDRHPFVHEIWDTTYSVANGYPEKSMWSIEKNDEANPWAELFEGKEVILPNRIQIKEYASVMEFVDDVKHIRDKGYTFYSSNFKTADQMLKDYFPEEYGERKILSYPIGQFISILNQLWDGEKQTIVLNEDLLIDCFASGWLAKDGISGKSYMQDLIYILPFFEGCKTVSEWEERIELLRTIRKEAVAAFDIELDPDPAVARWQEAIGNPLVNISTFAVPEEKLNTILILIQQLLQMAKDLFKDNEPVAIQDHVRNLDYILRQNEVSNELYSEERELVAEIFETLERPNGFSAKCCPSDISSALRLYINGNMADGEIQVHHVGLVNPIYFIDAASVKNKSKVHICMCDVENMPGGNKEYIWPLNRGAIQRCYEKTGNSLIQNLMQIMEVNAICNRYFMYCALRNKEVQLSWITNTNEQKILAPSSYIRLVMEAAGIGLMPAKRNDITYSKVAEMEDASSFIRPYKYEEMPMSTIKEARMDYALCPMKYVLSYVLEKYPSYQSEFQQTYVLNGVISAVYNLMEKDGVSIDEVYSNLISLFPNLRKIEKRQVYDYIGNDHGEHDMDYGNRTKCGEWYFTEERLKIHYPGQFVRQRSNELYGKQSTPDKRDGINFFEQPGKMEDPVEKLKEVCAFCPHINNCRNALFHEDQERLYD